MANRDFNQFRSQLEKGVVDLFMKAAIGSTGAVTINATQSKGVASITRTGVGAYDVVFSDKYNRLLGAQMTTILASGAPGSSSSTQLVVRADSVAASTKKVSLQFVGTDGAAIELVSGTSLLLKFSLKNSSI